MKRLFYPLKVDPITLGHRVVMAPLTRIPPFKNNFIRGTARVTLPVDGGSKL